MKQRFLLLWLMWFCSVESKVYPNSINRKTKIHNRQWGGMASNTGDNFGGWLVRIRSGGADTLSCCGSYFSPLLVISSANCIHPFRYQLEEANVVSTANMEDEDYNFSLVETVYTPEEFRPFKTISDLALVRLNMPLKGSLTEFIKLTNTWPRLEMPFVSFGWGFNSLEVQPATDEPRKIEVRHMELDECKSKFKRGFISDSVMCARLPVDPFKCLYDGGSPMVWKNELFAVASVGSTCKNTTIPGIYTSVNKLKAFIFKIQEGMKSGILTRRKRKARLKRLKKLA